MVTATVWPSCLQRFGVWFYGLFLQISPSCGSFAFLWLLTMRSYSVGFYLWHFFEIQIYTWEDLHLLLCVRGHCLLQTCVRWISILGLGRAHLKGKLRPQMRPACGHDFSEVLFPPLVRAETEKKAFPTMALWGLPPSHACLGPSVSQNL